MAPRKPDTHIDTMSTAGAVLEPEVVSVPAVTEPSQALAVQADDAFDTRGKDGFDSSDFVLPRVTIAQSSTPQTKRGNKAQIEALQEGHIFNTLTEENYGDATRIIVLGSKKTAHVFDDQGKIIERDVPWNSPRCEKPLDAMGNPVKDEKGKDKKSEAARCYELIVYLPDAVGEASKVALLRAKRTQLGPARKLGTFMGLTAGASWNAVYPVSTVPDTFESFSFFNWKFGMGKRTTPEQRKEAERLYATFAGKNIVVVEPEVDDDAGDRGAMAADQGDGI